MCRQKGGAFPKSRILFKFRENVRLGAKPISIVLKDKQQSNWGQSKINLKLKLVSI